MDILTQNQLTVNSETVTVLARIINKSSTAIIAGDAEAVLEDILEYRKNPKFGTTPETDVAALLDAVNIVWQALAEIAQRQEVVRQLNLRQEVEAAMADACAALGA